VRKLQNSDFFAGTSSIFQELLKEQQGNVKRVKNIKAFWIINIMFMKPRVK
jgi:hypothetical protein